MLDGASKFWAVRNAWSAAVQARQAAAPQSKGRFRRPTMNEQGRKWTINAGKYLANRPSILAHSRGISVQAPDVHAPTLALLDALPAKLLEEMDSRLSLVMFDAFNDWPVSSGYSKGALSLSFIPEGTSFVAVLGNAAPYSLLIKGGPGRKLIGTPGKSAAVAAVMAALQGVPRV